MVVKVEEKINLTCGKDGGVQNLEVLGVLSVKIASEEEGKIRIAVRNGDNRNLQIQVRLFWEKIWNLNEQQKKKTDHKNLQKSNPNIDKNLFKNNSVIGLKDASKSFPIGNDVGVLKWRFQSTDESEIPLTSKLLHLPSWLNSSLNFNITKLTVGHRRLELAAMWTSNTNSKN